MNKEEWRDITGYEGRYQVSNIGRVKRLERRFIDKVGRRQHIKELILKPSTNHNGYLRVNLYDDRGKIKTVKVHRLVCSAFHKNPENKPCVNHIDENRENNAASNLEWCTYAENNHHGTHSAKIGMANVKNKSKPVGQYTTDGELVKVWQSASEVYRQLGFRQGNISNVALGRQKTAYGYVWKFIEKRK